MNVQQVTQAALAHRHTRASFRNLDKHARNGSISISAATRLLRRNVRDVAPNTSETVQQAIARALLTHWHESSTVPTVTFTE